MQAVLTIVAVLVTSLFVPNGLTSDLELSRLAGAQANQATIPKAKSSVTAGTPAPCDAAENQRQPAAKRGHRVTLSWNASPPVTQSPQNAVVGYIVYRSTKSHDSAPTPINSRPVVATTCIDTHVEGGKTYYYTIRAVDAKGAMGQFSREIRVHIPQKLPPAAK